MHSYAFTAYIIAAEFVLSFRPRMLVLASASGALAMLCHGLPGALSVPGRWTITILLSAVLYWAFSDLPDILTGVLATVALLLVGAVSEANVLRTLGHEFIWLLVVAFAVGAVISANQLVEWCFMRSGIGTLALPALVAALTVFISTTAFLLPSTAARAAILLPIFTMLAVHASKAQRTALGLLFPTVILLSAGASLIGAGAHAVAAQYIEQHTGQKIDMMSWAALTVPFVFITTAAAAATIFFLHIPRDERRARIAVSAVDTALDANQRRSFLIIGMMIIGWVTKPWHGVGMVTIGLLGLAALLTPGLGGGVPAKTAFKAVEIELLLFLATTFVLADALIQTGAGQAMAAAILFAMPLSIAKNATAVAAILAAIGLTAHLVITSRTARVTVLLPTLVLPLVNLGHDPTMLVMVTVLATGFCQTLPASAKPVGVFASVSPNPFQKADLKNLSMLLLPQMLIALIVYARFY